MLRAIRFDHPVDGGGRAGLVLAPTGAIDAVGDAAAIRQALLLLLSTVPGERVMRPDYGCDLQRLVFEPNDDTTAGLAIHFVRLAVARWEPRVVMLSVDATRAGADEGRLEIRLEYRLRATGAREELVVPLQLGAGGAT